MKILLLGQSGMLGSCFFKCLAGQKDAEMYSLKKDGLDITDKETLEKVFERISPHFVINCAAYTAVDSCESDKDAAFKVNGEAPGEIARLCAGKNATLLHFSTDYVFDGKNDRGYKETDSPSPINIYGESKLEGEKRISENMNDYYIVRTSWLFGENGKNFVDTMIRLARKKYEPNVVGDQTGCPTYTKDLCEACVKYFLSKKLPFGIYHLTNSGQTSWYDFAVKIFKIMESDVKINKISSDAFPQKAKRPKCSILLNTKITEPLRSWEEALEAYLRLNFLV
ncbi:MAG: dTDP-4-dehydrorhamnose reductase [Candidatus Peregrinibacteria bacterium]